MDLSSFKDKKVFLTGHTGFKGSWMLAWLHSIGAIVRGYALNPNTDRDLYHIIEGDKLCDSKIADIRDTENIKKEILDFGPDFVFHLAAQPLVRYSYENPIETFEVNVMGTANVLEAIRSLDKPCIGVMITTDKVYENKEWHYPYRETDRLGGYDPYSASKASAEIVINSYRSSYFNSKNYESHQKSIASTRAGNVIGGGDWSMNRIIPDIVRALQSNSTISVRNPKAIRPWQHVLEPIHGYLMLGMAMYQDKLNFNSGWNFGPYIEDTYTVEEVVKKAINIWGSGNYESLIDTHAPHEAGLLKLDINKSINELGWKPRLTSDQAITWTIDYYKSVNPKETIYQQINKYESL